MRPYSTIQKMTNSLKSIVLAVAVTGLLASFTEDTNRVFSLGKSGDSGNNLKSSVGAVNMSKSVVVNRSMREVHELFLNSADKADFVITAPTAKEISEASQEVDQNFKLSTMWKASSDLMSEGMQEVNSRFEKENKAAVKIQPDVKASMEEVNDQFEKENL